MMCPVKSRNGNNLSVKKSSHRGETALVRFHCVLQRTLTTEMTFDFSLVVCALALLTGSSEARGQSSALAPVLTSAALPSHAGSAASPHLTEASKNEVSARTPNPAGGDETSAQTTTIATTEGIVYSGGAGYKAPVSTTDSAVASSQHASVPADMTASPAAPSPSAAADGPLSTPTAQRSTSPQRLSTEAGAPPTKDPLTTVSSQPARTVQDVGSTALASTVRPQSELLATAQPTTTGHPLTPATGRGPVGTTHQEVPSELNVGDEELKGPRHRSTSPLDPLLAGLLSVFIVTTAVVFVILFLKFRQRTNHPEFHRLQDLPMDDLMEDTPLSRYSY